MPSIEAQRDNTHALFAVGQGSQLVGDGRELRKFLAVASLWETADKLLLPTHGFPFSELALEGKQNGVTLDPEAALAFLTRTENAQPAVIISALARTAVLREAGLLALPGKGEPEWYAYNSLNIIAQAVNVGSLTIDGAARLGDGRGQAFKHAVAVSPKTTMVALMGLSDERVEEMRQKFGLEYCLLNSDSQTVLGGEVENKTGHDVTHAMAYIEEQGLQRNARRLNVDAAFHTKWMEPAVPIYEKFVDSVDIATPSRGKLVGGTTVRILETAADVRSELIGQLPNTERTRYVWHLLINNGVTTVTELTGQHRFMGTLRRQFKGDFEEIKQEKDGPIFGFRWSAPLAHVQQSEVVTKAASKEVPLSAEDAALKEEITNWYVKWLSKRSGKDAKEIQGGWKFTEELKLDSQDLGVLRSDLLDEFGKVVPDKEAEENDTVEKAIAATFRLVRS